MDASLTFNSGSATTIFSKVPVRLSGNVQISGGISCEVILTSAPQYKLKFLLTQGNIAASGGNGFVLAERYLSMFESLDEDYQLVWKNDQILDEKIGRGTPSVIETEDDLQKALDAASPGTVSTPDSYPHQKCDIDKASYY